MTEPPTCTPEQVLDAIRGTYRVDALGFPMVPVVPFTNGLLGDHFRRAVDGLEVYCQT